MTRKKTRKPSKSDSVSIDDPVRLYLREMGTISLLTRKGEVEIAKRIEAGQDEVLSAVANCGVTIREFVALSKQGQGGGRSKSSISFKQQNLKKEKKSSVKKEVKNLQKRVKTLKTECQKLEKLNARIDNGKLSEKMLAKVTGQSEKQQKIVEKHDFQPWAF